MNQIKTFIFDVDGVLAESVVYLIGDEVVRTMNSRDGYALQYAVKKGYNIAVITGGSSVSVQNRLKRLGVTDVFLKSANKLSVLKQYIKDKNLDPSEILYMGDDIPDYEVMNYVGLGTCPKNAAEEIKKIAAYVSIHEGGKGCVRDVLEQTLKVQENWFDKDCFDW